MYDWPPVPLLPVPWMTQRARLWRTWMMTGQAARFQAGYRALAGRRQDRAGLRAYGHALRTEWHRRIEQGPAGPALRRADHANYLGDRAVVRGLVDGWFAVQIARAGGAVPHEAVVEEMARLTRIFAGGDAAYPSIGGWNTQALLGEALIAHYDLTPASSLDAVLSEAFGAVGLQTLDALRAAETGTIPPHAAITRLSALALTLTDVLLGHDNAA